MGGQASCRYFGRGNSSVRSLSCSSFNNMAGAHAFTAGPDASCSVEMMMGEPLSVNLLAKCGEEYCTASNFTLDGLLV
jgi:hypothetical protein